MRTALELTCNHVELQYADHLSAPHCASDGCHGRGTFVLAGPDGVAATGADCTTDGAIICASCNAGFEMRAETARGSYGNSNAVCYNTAGGVRTEWQCPGVSNCQAGNGMQADDCAITSVSLASGTEGSSTKCTPGGACTTFVCTAGSCSAATSCEGTAPPSQTCTCASA